VFNFLIFYCIVIILQCPLWVFQAKTQEPTKTFYWPNFTQNPKWPKPNSNWLEILLIRFRLHSKSELNMNWPEILFTRYRSESEMTWTESNSNWIIHTRTDSTRKQMTQTQIDLNPTLTRPGSNPIQFKLYVAHANKLSSTYSTILVSKSPNPIFELTSHATL